MFYLVPTPIFTRLILTLLLHVVWSVHMFLWFLCPGWTSHGRQRCCGVQQTAHPPQDEYDVSQGESPALVHFQAQPQVRYNCHHMRTPWLKWPDSRPDIYSDFSLKFSEVQVTSQQNSDFFNRDFYFRLTLSVPSHFLFTHKISWCII